MIEQLKKEILNSGVYAVCSSIKNPTERRVFMQDFMASLNRRGILTNKEVEKWENEYVSKAEECRQRDYGGV